MKIESRDTVVFFTTTYFDENTIKRKKMSKKIKNVKSNEKQ